ncbi:MAG: hypothetical protein RL111_1265 [Pseudomonadota bacterium]|jgi:hypothetical protein
MSLFQELMNHSVRDTHFEVQWVKRYSPAEIRETIQSLVSTDQIDLAYALGDAGLAIYPESEDILAIAGLLALMRQDWPVAVELLTQLREQQGAQTPLFTFVMLVRALRCNFDHAKALAVAHEGLAIHPNQLELVAEKLALESMGPFAEAGTLPQ